MVNGYQTTYYYYILLLLFFVIGVHSIIRGDRGILLFYYQCEGERFLFMLVITCTQCDIKGILYKLTFSRNSTIHSLSTT